MFKISSTNVAHLINTPGTSSRSNIVTLHQSITFIGGQDLVLVLVVNSPYVGLDRVVALVLGLVGHVPLVPLLIPGVVG